MLICRATLQFTGNGLQHIFLNSSRENTKIMSSCLIRFSSHCLFSCGTPWACVPNFAVINPDCLRRRWISQPVLVQTRQQQLAGGWVIRRSHSRPTGAERNWRQSGPDHYESLIAGCSLTLALVWNADILWPSRESFCEWVTTHTWAKEATLFVAQLWTCRVCPSIGNSLCFWRLMTHF